MTDRELLERAARAAGYADLTEWSDKITDHDSPHYGMPALHPSGFGQQAASWNPLIDDGDALRLMVSLNLNVEFDSVVDGVGVLCYGSYDDGPEGHLEVFERQEDANSATRRAIVRAAAEMAE